MIFPPIHWNQGVFWSSYDPFPAQDSCDVQMMQLKQFVNGAPCGVAVEPLSFLVEIAMGSMDGTWSNLDHGSKDWLDHFFTGNLHIWWENPWFPVDFPTETNLLIGESWDWTKGNDGSKVVL